MSKLMIGICDDEPEICRRMGRIVESLLANRQMEYEISLCHSGEELLGIVKNLDLVFLDINMPEMDGIEVGRMIRIISPDCKIAMATGNTERINETFKINAFRFLSKPFKPGEIMEAIDAFINQNIGTEEMVLYRDRNKFSVQLKEIRYIKAFNGYIEARVGDTVFRKDITLRTLGKELDKRIFTAVSSSYYVNMFWVREYKNGKVMGEDFTLPVSRRRRKEFETARIYFELHYR